MRVFSASKSFPSPRGKRPLDVDEGEIAVGGRAPFHRVVVRVPLADPVQDRVDLLGGRTAEPDGTLSPR